MSKGQRKTGGKWGHRLSPLPKPIPKPKHDPLSSGPGLNAWCYICGAAHRWGEAHERRQP